MKLVISDFSETPSGRYRSDGPCSGEVFREEVLIPALEKLAEKEILSIKIDGVEGYGSSFLEEAFGGVVRKKIKNTEELLALIKFEYDDKYFEVFEEKIRSYIIDAGKY